MLGEFDYVPALLPIAVCLFVFFFAAPPLMVRQVRS